MQEKRRMEDHIDNRRKIGKSGEDFVAEYLCKMGHSILERNWRSGHLEIDIISIDSDGIHFVEVKTRKDNIQAPPQASVNGVKQKRIAQASRRFLRSSKGLPYASDECFFDVAAVTFESGRHIIEWFPQAYIPMYL